jgi:hypothetical protein
MDARGGAVRPGGGGFVPKNPLRFLGNAADTARTGRDALNLEAVVQFY